MDFNRLFIVMQVVWETRLIRDPTDSCSGFSKPIARMMSHPSRMATLTGSGSEAPPSKRRRPSTAQGERSTGIAAEARTASKRRPCERTTLSPVFRSVATR